MSTVFQDGFPIASYTFTIIRGNVVQIPFTFYDQDGNVEVALSAEIVVVPNGSAEITWDQGNGLFPNVGPGEFSTDLDAAYTTALAWDSGRYHINIVNSSGFPELCVTSGLIFVEDC